MPPFDAVRDAAVSGNAAAASVSIDDLFPTSDSTEPSTSSTNGHSQTNGKKRAADMAPLAYNPKRISAPNLPLMTPISASEIAALPRMSLNPLRDPAFLSKAASRRDGPSAAKKRKTDINSVTVAAHYNARPEQGVASRDQSPIIGLRRFNNWVKSLLIARHARSASSASLGGPNRGLPKLRVLELGCGKGGDLIKWGMAGVEEYVGVDIAETSIDQAKERAKNMHRPFPTYFYAMDCFGNSLADVLPPPQLDRAPRPFDVVSMQFCMHYAFETEERVRQMLENVTRWLRPGGMWVGTVPNSDILLTNLADMDDDSPKWEFGNQYYKVTFDGRPANAPIYGFRYIFWLLDAVDNVPEYVVHWDNFERLASEYGLDLVRKNEFHELFEEESKDPAAQALLKKMNVVNDEGESELTEELWDATSASMRALASDRADLYLAFAFQKRL